MKAFASVHGLWLSVIRQVAHKYLVCGEVRHAVAHIRGEHGEYRHEMLLALLLAEKPLENPASENDDASSETSESATTLLTTYPILGDIRRIPG